MENPRLVLDAAAQEVQKATLVLSASREASVTLANELLEARTMHEQSLADLQEAERSHTAALAAFREASAAFLLSAA